MKIFLIVFALSGLASCINQAKPPKLINVKTSVSDINQIDRDDSNYLRIAVLEKGYELSILDKSLKTANIDSIDQFITANRNILDKQKIALRRVDSSGDRFGKLLPVLKKHNVFKFRMEPTEE